MTRREVDAAIATLSRKQHGAWNRTQAQSAGASGSMIEARLRSGTWLRLDTAVFGHPAAVPTWERSVMAAVLAERWAVASHRSAAVLHSLDGFRPGRPEITVPPGAHSRGKLAIVHRGVDLRTTSLRGIPCVTVDQCFVDLAQVVSEEKLRLALGRRADTDPSMLDAVRDRHVVLAPRGGRNLRSLRATLERFGSGDVPSPSELERRLRRVLTGPDIPAVEWEAPFPGRDEDKRRVDALIRAWSVIVEGDGRAWHARVQDFERDRRRDAEAATAGLLTLRFTWHQLTTDPHWVRDVVVRTGSHRQAA
jgi:hypothetical protein